MRLTSILSSAFAASTFMAPFAAAEKCTFVISMMQNGHWDGLYLSCKGLIYKGHVPMDGSKEAEPVAHGDITCHVTGGCDDVEYDGYNYRFCHDGTRESIHIKSAASVNRDGGGLHLPIYPDGADSTASSASPFHSYASHTYWKFSYCG